MHQTEQINGQMVTLAREYRGITQSGLAEACGVSQQAIARLESGVTNAIGRDKLEKMARVLSFPTEFFSLNEVRLGFGSSSYFYRKKITTASERNKISGIVNLVRIHLAIMLKSVEISASLPLPRLLASHNYSPEQAANNLRAAWNVADGPIINLTNLIEKSGIVIIECPFGTNSIDGTSLWLNDLPPMILVNNSLPPDRYRFTIAHELGHLIMHDIPDEHMEDQADAFASELLMQEHPFRANVAQLCSGRPTMGRLLQMKPYWKVAVSAMVMRLHQIGYITDKDKRSLFIMLANSKMNQNEPQPFDKERPKLLKAIMDSTFDGYTSKLETASQLLLAYENDLKNLYGVLKLSEPPRLRVVS
jgi:Zn-dependent peptidase ImmA (M78 family)/transcriptional regulator with XRE-family HTH domain